MQVIKQDLINVGKTFPVDTITIAQSLSYSSDIKAIMLAGYLDPADGGKGIWRKVAVAPSHIFYFTSADGKFWEYQPQDGVVNARSVGILGTNSTTDTVKANAAVLLVYPYGTLYFPSHPAGGQTVYTLDTVDCSFAMIRGDGSGQVVLQHVDGSANPLLKTTDTDSGGAAYPYMGWQGLSLKAGNLTTYCLYMNGRVDSQVKFVDLQISGNAANTVVTGFSCRDWLNVSMYQCRWDGLGGWGIEVRNGNVFGFSHWLISGFSYDTGIVLNCKGFINLVLTNMASTKGAFVLDCGRIELNKELSPSVPARAIVRVLNNAAAAVSSTVNFAFRGVAVDCTGAGANHMLVTCDVGEVGVALENSVCYNMFGIYDNDTYTANAIYGSGKALGVLYDFYSTKTVGTDTPARSRRNGVQGMASQTYDSVTNLNNGQSRTGDEMRNRIPTGSGGRDGRYYARKAVSPTGGWQVHTATNLTGTGSITSGTTALVMTALSGTVNKGGAIVIPGAGVAGASLEAIVREVDETTKTLTISVAASTTVAGVTVAQKVQDLMAVPLIWPVSAFPSDVNKTYIAGDIAQNSTPTTAAPIIEWVCQFANTVGTNVGTWRPVKWIVVRSSTANRPTLSASDIGVMFMDTTLAANGKPIWWMGTNWVDALGATV